VRADGAEQVVRDGRLDASFPSERLALEALGRAHHFLATARATVGSPLVGVGPAVPDRSADVCVGVAAGTVAESAEHGLPLSHVGWQPGARDDDWCAGLLGGLADAAVGFSAAGAVVGEPGVLRLAVPLDLVSVAADALQRFGFAWTAERGLPVAGRASAPSVRHFRLTGGSRELLRFLAVADPAVSGVRGLSGAPVGADAGLEVVDLRPLGASMPMFDITTGTGDFVAAGVVSHNCFARNTHTYLDLDAGDDFDRQIVVKVNVGRVLAHELSAPRWQREPVAMGTNTDPYQRAEGRYRLMPGIVRALAGSGTPFSILTKGTVLSRDLPLLHAVAADVPVGLGVSIALLDRPLQARLEPGTPAPAARLELVRRIADAGLPCGVMVAPVLPLLTDSTEALDALLARIAGAGATSATVLALHLRPGTREWFLNWLERERPDLVDPYARLYRRGAYVDPAYRRALAARVAPLLRRHGLVAPVTPRPDGAAVRGFGPAGSEIVAPGSSAPSSVHDGVHGGDAQQLSLL
jgi:DNA repair photolyase